MPPVRSVTVIVFPGIQAIDVSGPMDVFEEANTFLPEADRYQVEVVGPEGVLAAYNGMRMAAHRTYEEAAGEHDLVLVAGGPKLVDDLPDAAMLECMRRLSRSTRRTADYGKELRRLQVEIAHLQAWVKKSQARIVIIFEGRDAAGKGGVIKRITERVSPRVFRVVALPAPTNREKSQIFMQRYIPHLRRWSPPLLLPVSNC